MKTIKFFVTFVAILFALPFYANSESYRGSYDLTPEDDIIIQEIHITESYAVNGFSLIVNRPPNWSGQISCPVRFEVTNPDAHGGVEITVSRDEANLQFSGSAGNSLDISLISSETVRGDDQSGGFQPKYYVVRLFISPR